MLTHVDSFCVAAKCVDTFGGGSWEGLRSVIIMMMKHKSLLPFAMCVNCITNYRERETDSAIMMMKHKYLLPFARFSYVWPFQLHAVSWTERHRESVWEIEHMPERVRVTHATQSEWGRTHGGPTLSWRAKERKYTRAELHVRESWQQREGGGVKLKVRPFRGQAQGYQLSLTLHRLLKNSSPPSAHPESLSTGTSN